MDYQEIDLIIKQIDSSLDKQINLLSLQLAELKKQVSTIESLILKVKARRSNNQ